MPDLPKPDVSVTTTETGDTTVVISRDGKEKKFESNHVTRDGVVKDIVEKVIADPASAEWLPKGKKF